MVREGRGRWRDEDACMGEVRRKGEERRRRDDDAERLMEGKGCRRLKGEDACVGEMRKNGCWEAVERDEDACTQDRDR